MERHRLDDQMDMGCDMGEHPSISLSLDFRKVANSCSVKSDKALSMNFWKLMRLGPRQVQHSLHHNQILSVAMLRVLYCAGHLHGYPHIVFWIINKARLSSYTTNEKTKSLAICYIAIKYWSELFIKICQMSKPLFIMIFSYQLLLNRCLLYKTPRRRPLQKIALYFSMIL